MKVGLYARVSSDAQDVTLSIGAQLRALREYAAAHGHEIVREFVDEAETGRTAARPAFKEMIALAKTKTPPFGVILVWKLNRFARNRLDSITYKALLRNKGIDIVSVNEPVDDTPTGRLLEGVIESIDEFYSANLGQDIKRGMREAARRGFFTGSRPPYGFHKVTVKDGDRVRHKLEPGSDDSLAVQAVHRIFDMALRDTGTKEIAKALNRDGIRTADGRRWGKTTVHKILTNEAYCGTLVWGGRPGHPAIRCGDPPVKVENAWPDIIDRATFDMVQRKMSSQRPQAVHPRTVPSFYLLSGLLHCSCGHAMIGRSAKSHRYYYYMCNGSFKRGTDACGSRSLPKDRLEHIVVEQIKERVLNDEWLEELVRLINRELDSSEDVLKERLAAIDADLNETGNKLSRLYDALESGKLNLDDLAPRIKELRARQDELNKARLQLEVERTTDQTKQVDIEVVKTYASDLKSLLIEADVADRKAFLRPFVKRIDINGTAAVIRYNIPLPRGEDSQTLAVLPIATPGGPWGTVPELLFEKKGLISALQHLLVSR